MSAESTNEPPRRPGTPTPGVQKALTGLMLPVLRVFFRPTVEGTEHLPEDRPFLLVANHSAGLGLAELACFSALYVDKYGAERPLAGFSHPIGFRVWPMTRLHEALGSVPSTYAAAEQTLDAGVPLLMFPGGDHETLRPVWQAYDVDFGGRQGFLKIAREANVPIVPMGIRGSHVTAPILWRSRLLARLLIIPRVLGLKRWGITLLGIIGAVALWFAPISLVWRCLAIWLWLTSPLIFLPILPWSIRFRIGPALEPDALFDPDDPNLESALNDVENAVEGLVRGR